MTRLIAAAALLLATVAPVFACDFTKSSSTDSPVNHRIVERKTGAA